MKNKELSLKDAITTLVGDGDAVVIGAGLEHNIPFAAAYEIIRQGKRDLDVIAPISDACADMLIGAGCVGRITGAWVGNVSGGLGHNYRRAVAAGEPHAVRVFDYSNFSLGMALMAGAYGIPYVPVRSLLGSDIVHSNPDLRLAEDPFAEAGGALVLVPQLKPGVAILPVQRSDPCGNCHHWGSAGLVQESALAAERVIVVADEMVSSDIILSDPGRVLFPGFRVAAVCHVPAAVHPSPMTGRWQRDTVFFNDYHACSRDRAGFLAWLDEWVLGAADHEAYRARLGARLEDLRIKGQALSEPANFAVR